MNNRIKISVIIPVYNAADLLQRSAGSILMQDFSGLELIIVNDGSTDETSRVCDELADNDMRVRVIHKENGGVSSARNAGLDAARGEYVMFVDADDAVRDGTFEKMYDKSSDFVLAGFEKVSGSRVTESYTPSTSSVYNGNEQICRFFDKVIPKKNTYILNSACFKLFRRSLLVDNEVRFKEGLSFAEDKIFVMSFLEHVRCVRTVSSVVYSYFLRPSSLSSDMRSDSHIEQIFRLLECYEPVLRTLETTYPHSSRISELYHQDLVGRYVCRILDIYASRKSGMLEAEKISILYKYIDGDRKVSVFGLRLGQVPNMILYNIGRPGFTVSFYRFTSGVSTFLKLKFHR